MRIFLLISLLSLIICAYARTKSNDKEAAAEKVIGDEDYEEGLFDIDDGDDKKESKKSDKKGSEKEKSKLSKNDQDRPAKEKEDEDNDDGESPKKRKIGTKNNKKGDDAESEKDGEKDKEGKAEKPRKSKKHVEEKDEDGQWMACDGDKDELCHCDVDELDCSNEALESEDEPLDTVDLDIKDEKFNVRVADFSKNEIREIRKGKILQGHETQIEELNLGHNVIDKIDSGAFASLKNLKKLRLNDNSLYKLKKSYFQGLDQLHMLDLSFNKIKTLPEDVFSEMKNLKKLILDGNEIESMSAGSFAGLDNLESLSLDDCGLKDKNQTDLFEKMPKLANISLRGNPITEVPLSIKSLKTLNNLDLSETNIVELHSMSFKDDVKLNFLIMENMEYLATIQECSFCGVDIETIILSNNSKLSYISPDAFGIQSDSDKKTETVKIFNIENCNITVLDEDLLIWDNLDNDQLHIGGNPINCSCETSHLLSGFYFEYKNSHVVPKCRYPEKLKGKLLKDVDVSDACEKMNRKGKWQKFAEILIFFLFFAGLSVGVYYIISTKKYLELIKTTPSGTPVHYSNLRNSANPDDRDALEADFQPRPAEV